MNIEEATIQVHSIWKPGNHRSVPVVEGMGLENLSRKVLAVALS